MSQLDLITNFYTYNRWANQRILDTAQNLTAEQFLADVGASFPSVRDTLVHIMLVHNNWLHRFQHQPLPPAMEFTDFPDLASIIAYWGPINAATDDYIQTLTDQDLSETINYVNSRGDHCSYQRWQMMLHQVNHATQHRSEIAVMLTDFGHSPGWLDYLVYIDQLST